LSRTSFSSCSGMPTPNRRCPQHGRRPARRGSPRCGPGNTACPRLSAVTDISWSGYLAEPLTKGYPGTTLVRLPRCAPLCRQGGWRRMAGGNDGRSVSPGRTNRDDGLRMFTCAAPNSIGPGKLASLAGEDRCGRVEGGRSPLLGCWRQPWTVGQIRAPGTVSPWERNRSATRRGWGGPSARRLPGQERKASQSPHHCRVVRRRR